MVTAGNGVIIFHGLETGRDYAYNFYSSDVIGAAVTLNANGLAGTGSQNFILVPENVVIKDISFASTNTVSTNWVLQVNDVNTGSVVPIANCLNSLATRALPNIPVGRGRKFTMIQA